MATAGLERLQSFRQLKLLSDPRRLAVLRVLMSAPASLTQIGQALGKHPAWVRHHLKQLEAAGLVELLETHSRAGTMERIYRSRAGGFWLQELILPEDPERPAIVLSGSHDLALELLADQLSPRLDLLTMTVGSLDGLVGLRENLCHLCGCHLLDTDGEYNLPFVRRIFPDREMVVMTLANRLQGLMTAPGNPKGIRSLFDLAREDVTFVNRNPGSGTRLWLDRQIQGLGIAANAIRGYGRPVRTHTESALAVQRGEADAALGLQAAARGHGLEFLPLFQERFDLVFPRERSELLSPVLEALQTQQFRRSMEALSGYETARTGERIPL
ncbi:MAG: substrate-binding domain-containing protein [Anaerolineales bacterium]